MNSSVGKTGESINSGTSMANFLGNMRVSDAKVPFVDYQKLCEEHDRKHGRSGVEFVALKGCLFQYVLLSCVMRS